MPRLIAYLLLVCLVAVGCGGARSATAGPAPEATGKVLVLLTAGTTPQAIVAEFPALNLTDEGRASRSQNLYQLAYRTAGLTPAEVVARLAANPRVVSARPATGPR